MASRRRAKPQSGRAAAPPPATEGLTSRDRERAASLADEGGAAAASVEGGDRPAEAPTEEDRPARPLPAAAGHPKGMEVAGNSGSVLCELSIIPLGGDIHLSDELAEVLEVIDASGLAYQLGPAGTCIEGSWDDVMPVVRACHDRARRLSKHVITILKIEDDEGQRNKISRNVQSVEGKASRPLSTASAP